MSATYKAMRTAFLADTLPDDVGLALVRSSYTFSADHASYSADISPHSVNITEPLHAEFESPAIEFVLTRSTHVVAHDTANPDTLTPPGATIKAIVVVAHSASGYTAPLLYLDSESIPELPGVTLGGAVELDLPTLVRFS
jgi:hypothetical protein